jgi:hypothetical protein
LAGGHPVCYPSIDFSGYKPNRAVGCNTGLNRLGKLTGADKTHDMLGMEAKHVGGLSL